MAPVFVPYFPWTTTGDGVAPLTVGDSVAPLIWDRLPGVNMGGTINPDPTIRFTFGGIS